MRAGGRTMTATDAVFAAADDRSDDTPAKARTAVLIVNPNAGSETRAQVIQDIVKTAADLGWRVTVAETQRENHATQLAADAAAAGHPVVLAAGGDGTLNEVIQALAGTETVLGAIPLGTMNVWAREMGLSLDPVEATRQLLQGRTFRVDLGRVNGRYFLLMAGMGFDAVAVYAIQGKTKSRFGPLAFVVAGVVAALRTRGTRVRIRADGQTFETNAALITVGNTRLWAGAVQITHHASATDGRLDVCIFPGRAFLTKVKHFALVLIGRHDDDPDVTYLQVRSLHIATRPPIPIQVDGESFGTTPAQVDVVPGCLRVLVGQDDVPTLGRAAPEPPEGAAQQ
jgi:diacylglycerol kinase (ATP)